MFDQFDLVIVGAGPVGCVVAERAASQLGWNCLIVEKRNHIAGNCYDRVHESGVLIHQYGPHYFRTNDRNLLEYLSQFTDWIPGDYFVKSLSQGRLFPFPLNLKTLEEFFGRTFTPAEAQAFLEEKREKIDNPSNSEEFVLSRVGRELYEAFYLGYTVKQWDLHPRQLDASVCGRIPVRLNRDERYVDHQFQVTPKHGFTAMFSKMIHHPRIKVMLQTDFRDIRNWVKPRRHTVYCGPIDEYFDRKLGALPWRSLNFEFKHYEQEFMQPCVQINYPNDFAYTRSVEIKRVTRQLHPHTVISYEYPTSEGDPYYPVPNSANRRLFQSYWSLAEAEERRSRTLFAGRLAQYKYINMDEAITEALRLFDSIGERAA